MLLRSWSVPFLFFFFLRPKALGSAGLILVAEIEPSWGLRPALPRLRQSFFFSFRTLLTTSVDFCGAICLRLSLWLFKPRIFHKAVLAFGFFEFPLSATKAVLIGLSNVKTRPKCRFVLGIDCFFD